MSYKVSVRPEVARFASAWGRNHRRALKRAILSLAQEKGDISALSDELSGFH
jgi:hypothetical protein